MKGPTRAWKRSGVLIGAAAAGMIGVGLCAVPASAHTPTWSVTCSEVSLNLTAYNSGVQNTVTVEAGGKDLLPTKTFGSAYHTTLKLPEHSSELSVHLVVKAGDGDQYSKDDTKTSPVCEGTPPTKPSTPPSTPSRKPTEKPSQKPSEKPSESAPASAVPAGDSSQPPKDQDLAETGSSSSTPIIAGAAALVVVAGGGILIATRRRSAARH